MLEYKNWTIEDFKKIPIDNNYTNENNEISSIVIIPSESYHESGYRIIEIILKGKDNKPICRINAGIDHLWFQNLPEYINIDCLPKSGLLRINGTTKMYINIIASSTNIAFK